MGRFIRRYLDALNSYGEKQSETICECGNETFKLIRTDAYELSARCTKCGVQEVVYDG